MDTSITLPDESGLEAARRDREGEAPAKPHERHRLGRSLASQTSSSERRLLGSCVIID